MTDAEKRLTEEIEKILRDTNNELLLAVVDARVEGKVRPLTKKVEYLQMKLQQTMREIRSKAPGLVADEPVLSPEILNEKDSV